MKKLSSVMAVCLALLTLASALLILPVGATDEAFSGVYDHGSMLTSSEKASLTAQLQSLSRADDITYCVATYDARNRWDDYTGDEFRRTLGLTRYDDLILLVITYDRARGGYYYDMYTWGSPYGAINTKEVNYILDHSDVYRNLKSGRIAEGTKAFFDLSSQAYNGRVGAPMLLVGIISAIIAVVIALLVCRGVVSSYKAKNTRVDYPLEHFAKLKLTKEEDRHVDTRVIAIPLPRSNGGGRSVHGGGSGHRGGR